MTEVSEKHFFWKAIWADFRKSRKWRLITVFYTVAALCFFGLRFVTTWTPAHLISSWSGLAKLNLVFAVISVALVLILITVVDGAHRIHVQASASLLQEIHEHEWLVKQADQDRRDVGKGVAITGCELTLDLECSRPYVDLALYSSTDHCIRLASKRT
jgi:hypothetical protein